MHGKNGKRPEVRSRFGITIRGVAILLLLVSGALRAQELSGAGTQSGFTSGAAPSSTPGPVATPVQTKKFTLADFAWLPGRWQGQWGPRVAEQVWTPAKAGVMLGVSRVIENDKTLVIELLELTETPNGIEYRIRHFTPALAPWEKSSSTLLNLASIDSKKIVFENSVDGQPKHAILDRVDGDTFVSRSEIIPQAGDTQTVEITFRRQKPTVPKP
jgi:Domain of unknown function (DUF6265)